MTVELIQPKALLAVHEPTVVDDDGFGVVAVCLHPDVAARIAALWERHGLADVGDTVAEVVGE